jgi:hypothetical protein
MVNVRVVAGITGTVMGLLVALTLCAGRERITRRRWWNR